MLTPIRIFNKYVTNRVLGLIARTPVGPFAFVRHVGRKSGKHYQTTVIVFALDDGFLLALTYGTNVDWYKNVLAAGKCIIVWHRREYSIERVEPLTLEAARPLLHEPFRTLLDAFGTQDFVRMYTAHSIHRG